MTRTAKAFTVTELLVVIGVLAVLVALLVPAVRRARAQAQNVNCLSNLRQIGSTAFLWAAEHDRFLPPCAWDTIEKPPADVRQWLDRQLQGGVKIYYCPSNGLWDGESPPEHDPEQFLTSGRIRYWCMANPLPPPPGQAQKWLDINGNGTNRDEYMCKAGEKNASTIAIATDQSRQESNPTGLGWYMIHGSGGRKTSTNSWKNNLYGDGHVESVKPDAVIARWGTNNPAGW